MTKNSRRYAPRFPVETDQQPEGWEAWYPNVPGVPAGRGATEDEARAALERNYEAALDRTDAANQRCSCGSDTRHPHHAE
jgi:hypothetical protein